MAAALTAKTFRHMCMWKKSINMCQYIHSAYPKETDACVSTHVQSYIMVWSLILHMRVCVCVSVHIPRPWRFPLSCSLKFALRLFHWTSALSSKARSRLLLPFLSRKKKLSVSLFSLHILLGVIRCFMLMHLHGLPTTSYPRLSDTTALPRAPWRLIQTHKVVFRVFMWCTKPSCHKTLNMKRHFVMLWKLFVSVLPLNPNLALLRTFSLCNYDATLCSCSVHFILTDWLWRWLSHLIQTLKAPICV